MEADVTAPSKPDLLKHSGRGDFPWCVVRGAMLENGSVQVRLEPIAGICIELDDARITGPGALGLWTRADSVTLFDDFSFEAGR